MTIQLNALTTLVDRIIIIIIIINNHNHLQNQWIPVVDIQIIIEILGESKIVLVLDLAKDRIRTNLTT